jgi:alpha-1,2-mannosyltransferase
MAAQLLLLTIILIFYLLVVITLLLSAHPQENDFFRFYQGARFFIQGQSIYTPILIGSSSGLTEDLSASGKDSTMTMHPNLNSPLHTLTIVPFAYLPYRAAYGFWTILSLSAGLIAVIITFNGGMGCKFHLARCFWPAIVLLAYSPSFENLIMGQYGFIVFLFLSLIWLASKKGKVLTTGILLGFAICLKAFFGIFLIFFGARRQWRLLAISLGTYLVANLIGLGIFGLSTYRQYIANHAFAPLFVNSSWNASLMGYFTRILGGAQNIPFISMPVFAYSLIYGLSALIMLIVLLVAISNRQEPQVEQFDEGFSITAIAMLLISPYAWIYYFPCLILPLVVFWRLACRSVKSLRYRIALFATWILSGWRTDLIQPEDARINDPKVWFLSSGIYFYALAFLFVIAIAMLCHSTWAKTSDNQISTEP